MCLLTMADLQQANRRHCSSRSRRKTARMDIAIPAERYLSMRTFALPLARYRMMLMRTQQHP